MEAQGASGVGHFLQTVGGAFALTVLAVIAGSAVTSAAAAAEPGQLAVEAAPTKAIPDDSVVTVRVANTGGGPVQAITIQVDGPPGVRATVKPASIGALAAGSSVLAKITARGVPERRPAQLVVRATGRSSAGGTAALTSIDLVPAEPAASLTLTGNTRLTDSSPADLVAVLANSADVPAEVSVRATAGQHVVRLVAEGGDVASAAPGEPLEMKVPAHGSEVVLVQVQANRPLRRGATALVVTATVTAHGAGRVDVSASRELDVALSADILPGLLGVGSVVVVPGLVAVWAFLTVLHRDRRRVGLKTPAAGSQIWDNKLWLLVAVAVSLVGAVFYSVVAVTDLLDTYTLSDITVVSVVLGLLGAGAARLVVWWHRREIPAVTPTSAPLAVLTAARKSVDEVSRPVYRTEDGKRGLLVHTDRDAVVLAPPVEYTEIDIRESLLAESLSGAITKIEETKDAKHRTRFSKDDPYIDAPRAFSNAAPSSSTKEPILRYVDTF